MFADLVKSCRSYRRFYEDVPVEENVLKELVDLARQTASTANSQALKFRIVTKPEEKEALFACLGWAGALPDWDGPEKGERPGGYIVICCDLELAKSRPVDDGITAQTIMLGAVEKGFGGCMLASVKREEAAKALNIPRDKYSIDLVLAIGKPKETVVMVPLGPDGSVKYYRDEKQVHYVPKRSLGDILL